MSSDPMGAKHKVERVVLVIGACGLDRILTVPSFPIADSKIRTSSFHEIGGGNAANTAAAMGLLTTSSFLSDMNLCIRLLTKIGDDYMGQQLADELQKSGVDVTSPLFLVGHQGSTTSFTSIIVSAQEHTRTCIHTPGTCGELTIADVEAVDLEDLFRNVVHVHSDTRHTEASLMLAREARRRNIPVSVDAEKDRESLAFDHLLEASTMIFTNSSQLHDYLLRRTKELEANLERHPLPDPIVIPGRNTLPGNPRLSVYAKAVEPIFYFRRFGIPDENSSREVIITKGSMGALHLKCSSYTTVNSMEQADDKPYQEITVHEGDKTGRVTIDHSVIEHTWAAMYQESKLCYDIQSAGVIANPRIVDTTGAGDAFIAGYITMLLGTSMRTQDTNNQSLRFASWVGGCNLTGAGARSSLPHGSDVDARLGLTFADIGEALETAVGSFEARISTEPIVGIYE